MIKPPSYKKNAVPSPRGWRHPRTGELLKKQKLTQEQINEYLGTNNEQTSEITLEVVETMEPTQTEEGREDSHETVNEDITVEELELEEMTKIELEEIGREHGIELDRREKKSSLIDKLKDAIS